MTKHEKRLKYFFAALFGMLDGFYLTASAYFIFITIAGAFGTAIFTGGLSLVPLAVFVGGAAIITAISTWAHVLKEKHQLEKELSLNQKHEFLKNQLEQERAFDQSSLLSNMVANQTSYTKQLPFYWKFARDFFSAMKNGPRDAVFGVVLVSSALSVVGVSMATAGVGVGMVVLGVSALFIGTVLARAYMNHRRAKRMAETKANYKQLKNLKNLRQTTSATMMKTLYNDLLKENARLRTIIFDMRKTPVTSEISSSLISSKSSAQLKIARRSHQKSTGELLADQLTKTITQHPKSMLLKKGKQTRFPTSCRQEERVLYSAPTPRPTLVA